MVCTNVAPERSLGRRRLCVCRQEARTAHQQHGSSLTHHGHTELLLWWHVCPRSPGDAGDAGTVPHGTQLALAQQSLLPITQHVCSNTRQRDLETSAGVGNTTLFPNPQQTSGHSKAIASLQHTSLTNDQKEPRLATGLCLSAGRHTAPSPPTAHRGHGTVAPAMLAAPLWRTAAFLLHRDLVILCVPADAVAISLISPCKSVAI